MASSSSSRSYRSSRRPAMISELALEAQNTNWDESGNLKYFLRIADRSRKAGKAAVENNDLETAFVMFARAATIVLEKLPVHREYNTALTSEQRQHLQTNGADILDHLSKLKPILQDRHDQWSSLHPDEPDEPDPPSTHPPQPGSSNRDRQRVDRERQQWEQARVEERAREDARIQRQNSLRQRPSGAGGSYGASPATSAAASAIASARQAANVLHPDTRQQQQEYLQKEEQRQRQMHPDYDRLRQDELQNRQSEERRRENDSSYNSKASASSAPYFPPTSALPPSIYGSSFSSTPTNVVPSGVSMPTPSTSTSTSSVPVSASYSGASHREFPQAASIPSSTVYHPPPASKPNLYPGQSAPGASSSYLPTPPYEKSSRTPFDGSGRYETSDSTDSDSTGDSLNHWREGARPRQDNSSPSKPPSRSPSHPPPVTTTSPPPSERIQYPQLMSQHQQTQGYTPSLNSMFISESKPPFQGAGDSLLLDHRSRDLYSTDMLPHPSSSQPAPGMPQPQPHPSQSRFREPSPNPPSHSSYSTRPQPPVPSHPPPPHLAPPRQEDRISRGATPAVSDLKTVLLPRESLPRFLTIAKVNTSRNRETCGLLLGKDEGRKYVVTTLLIPKQHATSDTCTMDEEELVLQFTEERGLFTLGWIHTHPTQSCFMSSVDLHTHSGFQCMLPESFAVVCAPRSTPNFGIFRLTDPPGLQTILECNAKEAFHPHPDIPIYTDADKGHVQMRDLALEIVDIR